VWAKLLAGHPAERAMQTQGIVPILSRLTIVGTDATIRVDAPATATGGYQLARREVDGAVDKLFLNMWVEVRGAGRSGDAAERPGRAGRRRDAVRRAHLHPAVRDRRRSQGDAVRRARHARGAGRRVRRAGADHRDGAAARRHRDRRAVPPRSGGHRVRPRSHTDSNQHVNSLVYPRLFAEAALRRLAERERPRRVLVRALDIAYRKPSFAGDRVRIHTRLFAIGDQVGAAGFVADVDDPAARPRSCARMLFG
jgi:hypothetical protein